MSAAGKLEYLLYLYSRRGQVTEGWGEAPDESRLNLAAHTRGTVRRPQMEIDIRRQAFVAESLRRQDMKQV